MAHSLSLLLPQIDDGMKKPARRCAPGGLNIRRNRAGGSDQNSDQVCWSMFSAALPRETGAGADAAREAGATARGRV
jgi:hypothetical protein